MLLVWKNFKLQVREGGGGKVPTVTIYGFFKDILHVSTGVVRNLVKTKVPRRLRHSVHTIAILHYSF